MDRSEENSILRAARFALLLLIVVFAIASHAVENRSAYPGQLTTGSAARP